MKTRNFLAVALSAVVLLFGSCKPNNGPDEEVTPTGISLSSSSIEVAVGATQTLAYVLTPTGAAGTVTWASQDATIASVNNGVVVGVRVGTTTIVATCGSLTATCAVTVTAGGPSGEDESLNGSNYYVIFMDGASSAKIANKIVADFRPDDVETFLYVWDASYTAGTPTGPNSYGEVDGWISLVVTGTAGYSGAGFNCTNLSKLDLLADISNNPSEYFLHIAFKTQQAGRPVLFGFDGSGTGRVVLGSAAFVDNGATYPAYQSITTDGEWNSVDIPFTYLANQGLIYRTGNTEPKNVMFVLSGATSGTTMDVDAIFFYKKS